MPPDYVSTTDVSCDEAPKRTKEHLALQSASQPKTHEIEKEQLSRSLATAVKVIDGAEENLVKTKSRESTTQRYAEERSKSRHSTTVKNEEMNRLNSRASVSGVGKRNSKSPHLSTQEKTQNLELRSQSKNTTTAEEEEEEPPYVIIKDGSSTREKRGKVVVITDTRFSPRHVTLYAGESLNFQLENVIEGGEQQSKVEQVMYSLSVRVRVYFTKERIMFAVNVHVDSC